MKLKECITGNQGQQFGFPTEEINVNEDDASPATPTPQMSPLIDANNSNTKKRKYVRARPTNKTVFGLVEEQGASRDIYNTTLIDQLKLHNKYLCELVVEFRRFNNQGRRDSPITSSPIKDVSVMDMTIEALDSESSITSSGVFYSDNL